MAQLHTQGLHRVLNMSDYGPICLNNAWRWFNAPQDVWTWFNIAKCLYAWKYWINCSMSGFSISPIILDIWQGFEYASAIKHWILNMLQYSYDKIIIIADAIKLKFLAVRFVHTGPLQLTISSFFNISFRTWEQRKLINF